MIYTGCSIGSGDCATTAAPDAWPDNGFGGNIHMMSSRSHCRCLPCLACMYCERWTSFVRTLAPQEDRCVPIKSATSCHEALSGDDGGPMLSIVCCMQDTHSLHQMHL